MRGAALQPEETSAHVNSLFSLTDLNVVVKPTSPGGGLCTSHTSTRLFYLEEDVRSPAASSALTQKHRLKLHKELQINQSNFKPAGWNFGLLLKSFMCGRICAKPAMCLHHVYMITTLRVVTASLSACILIYAKAQNLSRTMWWRGSPWQLLLLLQAGALQRRIIGFRTKPGRMKDWEEGGEIKRWRAREDSLSCRPACFWEELLSSSSQKPDWNLTFPLSWPVQNIKRALKLEKNWNVSGENVTECH